MEYNTKKELGKIFKYDGEAGIIISKKDEYIFSKKDLKDKNINENDLVNFYSNTLPFGKEKVLIAKNIKSFQDK